MIHRLRENASTACSIAVGALLLLSSGPVLAAGGAAHVSSGPRGVRVTGDSQNNDVSISQSGGTITVVGRNGTGVTLGPGATRDPAHPNDPNRAVVTGVGPTTRVRVDVQSGDDVVQVDDLNVDRLEVKGRGAGDNDIDIDDTRVGDKLEIETGSGDDTVDVTDTAWGRREVDTGTGTDTVNGIPGGKGGAGQVGTPPTPNPNPNPTPTPGGGKGMPPSGATKAPIGYDTGQQPNVPHVPSKGPPSGYGSQPKGGYSKGSK